MWLYFSILAVLLTLAIIAGIVNRSQDQSKIGTMARSVEELAGQCDFVCSSGVDTRLPVEVELPSGIVLYTREKKICAVADEESRCAVCSCDLEEFSLDLNTTFARRAFKSHDYLCEFTRRERSVQLDCQG